MTCSNCGHELMPDVKFCSNCGAPVTTDTAAGSQESAAERRERERREDFERAWGSGNDEKAQESMPDEPVAESDQASDTYDSEQEYGSGFATKRSTWEIEREQLQTGQIEDEWSMANLGPAKPARRRRWLWVLLSMVIIAVLACCIFGWWLTTDSGTEWFEGIATQAAEEMDKATEAAATPLP